MSEIDEPPAKVLRIDKKDGNTIVTEMTIAEMTEAQMSPTYTQAEDTAELDPDATPDLSAESTQDVAAELMNGVQSMENMEEGQEEWLSEEIYTDDELNPVLKTDDSQLGTSQDEAAAQPDQPEHEQDTTADSEVVTTSQQVKPELNIEETMKHLDGKADKILDDFDRLLLMKTEEKPEVNNLKVETKPEQDDGNDTDDLLRMLGGDDNKSKKKLTKTVKDLRAVVKTRGESSDDDGFVYEGATIKKLKAAKTALSKKQPAVKAEPEDMGDGDDETEQSSDDEGSTMKKMFGVSKLKKAQHKPKSTAKPTAKPTLSPVANVVVKRVPPKLPIKVINNIPAHSTPLKQCRIKKITDSKPIVKRETPSPAPKVAAAKVAAAKVAAAKIANLKSVEIKKETTTKPLSLSGKATPPNVVKSSDTQPIKDEDMELDEIIDGEDFLDEDEFDLDEEEFDSEMDNEMSGQRIMRPEMMDEEVPSDGESRSDDASIYDELPSSDSEDMEDWFQLDIRAERAGDYIPLLGGKARELLIEEKRRVAARLQTLKNSLSALTESGKRQADELRDATMNLTALDDMLKAS